MTIKAPEASKTSDIGMRNGYVLCNLSKPKQLDLIAEGFPVLLQSAEELLTAADALQEQPRAAAILQGQAAEELAKILILFDIVRCPPKLRSSRIKPMMSWFYSHLARLIYTEAQDWKPSHVQELQEYVDTHRKSHYGEGNYGEYILPNWTIFSRESSLYADMVRYEEGDMEWSAPSGTSYRGFLSARDICNSLKRVGAFSRKGLDIVSSSWAGTVFKHKENYQDAISCCETMLMGLQKANLMEATVEQEDADRLYHRWQMPMYYIDFRSINVSLEELQDARDRALWSEAGY